MRLISVKGKKEKFFRGLPLRDDGMSVACIKGGPNYIDALMRPEKEGVNLLKKWLSYAVEKYQLGTVRSCLMRLRLFYKILTQQRKSKMSDASMDTFSACRDLTTSRSAAPQKKVLKYDEDFNKPISSEQFYKV